MRHYQFQLDPLFAGLKPADPDAEVLLHDSRVGGRVLDAGDQALAEPASARSRLPAGHRPRLLPPTQQRAGRRPRQRRRQADRGAKQPRAGGLIRTALRATDILMDRVWQLEKETFHDTPGFVFAPITEVVDSAEDPTALHPEIQRQAANIRTDLDRFSMLEISSLVRHGYCVGRKACRAHPELFGPDLPGTNPWDPVPSSSSKPLTGPGPPGSTVPARESAAATVDARTLQASALRRIWSTLLDRRDWVSYLYVPLLVPILILLPYFVVKSYQRSVRINHLIDSLSQGSRDLEVMSSLLEGRMTPWTGETGEEVRHLDEPDFKGFEILQDSRIIDMRAWKPTGAGKSDSSSLVYGYRRLKILKRPENTGNNLFRDRPASDESEAQVRFPEQQIAAEAAREGNVESPVSGEKTVSLAGERGLLQGAGRGVRGSHLRTLFSGEFLRTGEARPRSLSHVQADTAEVTGGS